MQDANSLRERNRRLILFSTLPHAERILLLILENCGGDDQRPFPCVKELAAAIGTSKRWVRQLLSGLVEKGILETVPRAPNGSTRTPYRVIQFDRLIDYAIDAVEVNDADGNSQKVQRSVIYSVRNGQREVISAQAAEGYRGDVKRADLLSRSQLPANEKLLLIRLAEYAESGECPSNAVLAQELSVREARIYQIIRKLTQKGILSSEERPGWRTRRRIIHWECIPFPEDSSPPSKPRVKISLVERACSPP